jgi:hypothetical protein
MPPSWRLFPWLSLVPSWLWHQTRSRLRHHERIVAAVFFTSTAISGVALFTNLKVRVTATVPLEPKCHQERMALLTYRHDPPIVPPMLPYLSLSLAAEPGFCFYECESRWTRGGPWIPCWFPDWDRWTFKAIIDRNPRSVTGAVL